MPIKKMLRTELAPIALAASTIVAMPAFAEDRVSLVESTYVDHGSVALDVQSMPIGNSGRPTAGVEWSWRAHPRLSLGVHLGSSLSPIRLESADNEQNPKKGSLIFVAMRSEAPAYEWQMLTVTANLEVGTIELGYRDNVDDERTAWKHDSGALVTLGTTAYAHISQETDLGLTLGYQAVKGLELADVSDANASGPVIGVRLKRWF